MLPITKFSRSLLLLLLPLAEVAGQTTATEGTWAQSRQVRELISGIKAANLKPVAVGKDNPLPPDLEPAVNIRFPAQSHSKARSKSSLAVENSHNRHPAINRGFMALGPKGKTGTIDGPGKKGNGTYRVDMNEDYEIRLAIGTGYMNGHYILSRDPAAGKDRLRFIGRLWDNDRGEWKPREDTTSDVTVRYDAQKDEGSINWAENGTEKREGYWDGRQGNTSMTIEFGGGWDHDFKQDR